MTNDAIRFFLALVQYGNEATAAQNMHVNHSYFSRALKTLEDELGVQLYDRQRGRAKRIVLTPYGEYFLPYAQTQLHLSEKLHADFDSLAAGQVPVVNIAVVPTLNLMLHKHFLLPFKKDNPDFRWRAYEYNVADMEHAILTEAAEIGFSNSDLLHPENFQALVNLPTQYHIVCRKDTQWLDIQRSYKIKDLAKIPLFLTVNSSHLVYTYFQRAGIRPQVIATNYSRRITVFNTLSDFGITLYPSLYPPENPELTWVTLDEPGMTSQDILFKNPAHKLSPMAQAFVTYYQQHSQV